MMLYRLLSPTDMSCHAYLKAIKHSYLALYLLMYPALSACLMYQAKPKL